LDEQHKAKAPASAAAWITYFLQTVLTIQDLQGTEPNHKGMYL
jgi:hypothetical protein